MKAAIRQSRCRRRPSRKDRLRTRGSERTAAGVRPLRIREEFPSAFPEAGSRDIDDKQYWRNKEVDHQCSGHEALIIGLNYAGQKQAVKDGYDQHAGESSGIAAYPRTGFRQYGKAVVRRTHGIPFSTLSNVYP